MAKVTMPLLSGSASGKLANAMVFFSWKGIAVVRQWLKPANPQVPAQGDVRIMLGGTGRAVGEIAPNTGSTVVGKFAQQLIDLGLIPSGQTKQSYLVKYILQNYITGSTSYALQLSAITNHAAYTAWQAAAVTLEITDFDLAYAAIAPYDKALGLYLIAKAAIAIGLTGTPYSVALATWTATQINGLINDFTSA